MHQRQTLLALPLVLVAFTASAEVEFGAQWLQFDYREESDAGSILNEESGDIPGVYLAWRNQIDRLWLELEGHYAKGSVDYEGGTQSGRPLSTETDQRLVQYRLRAGGSLPINNLDVAPYGMVAHQRWDRFIKPTSSTLGLREDYRWWEAGAGVRACGTAWQERIGALCLSAEAFRTFNGGIEVHLESVQLGRPRLELGEGNGYRLELDWSPAPVPAVNLSLFYEQWHHGESNTVSVQRGGTIFLISEPQSDTARLGARVALKL